MGIHKLVGYVGVQQLKISELIHVQKAVTIVFLSPVVFDCSAMF